MTVNERIKKLRNEKKITLEDLAKVLGTTKQTIYKYENGIITNIPYDKIVALSKVLKTTPNFLMGWEVPSYNPETGILTIPFISQKLSAGPGEEYLSDEALDIKNIDVLANMIKSGVDRKSLVCAEAKGDSMIGANIFSGDYVIFAKGLISGEGIYVLSLCNEVLIKRLSFNPIDNTLTIISENPKYPPKTISSDNDNVRILGKVVGWFHSEMI